MKSLYEERPLEMPVTVRTETLQEAENAFVVTGPFGFTGVYPLTQPETQQDGLSRRHCSLYYIKLAANDLPARAVVTDNTTYKLCYQEQVLKDAEICTVCKNRSCPPNQNPNADIDETAGVMLIPVS